MGSGSAAACRRDSGLGAAGLGMAQALLEEVPINSTTEPPELTQDGETDAWGSQNLVSTRTWEKGALTPQETDPDLPVSVQESSVEAWVGEGLLQRCGH